MRGYEASARIVKASPRLARAGRTCDPLRATGSVAPVEMLILAGPVDRPTTLRERLHAGRERWSQLTFFLFDAESWRT